MIDDLVSAAEATGRGTWSGAPALPQWALVALHGDAAQRGRWTAEVDGVRHLLRTRRAAFMSAAEAARLPLAPGGPGYFAFLPHSASEAVVTAAEVHGVFLVPLADGVRIGLCAIAAADAPGVAQALASGLGL